MGSESIRRQGSVLLFLPWEFDLLGGVDVVADRLWKGLEAQIPGRSLIGIQDWTLSGERQDEAGRRFLHLNFPAPVSAERPLSARYLLTFLRRAPAMLAELRRHQVKIVNFHFPSLNIYPLALLKRLGLWKGKIVLSFHGSDVAGVSPDSDSWRLIAGECDGVTACSAALADRVNALGIFKGCDVKVVYNGIDCDVFQSLAVAGPENIPSRFVLNVGNYVSRKAQDVLLDAFSQIAPAHPDVGLVLVGGTDRGEWLQLLKDQAVRLGLIDRVRFLENLPQSSVSWLMSKALCLAHSSQQEAFGLVVIEAGACRLPVVAMRVGGIPEIITSASEGLLVDAGDCRGMAQAISDTLSDADASAARADRLHDRVLQNFSDRTMIQGYFDVYLRVSG
ncbi:glycosyltransferase family 4 protein [Zoogloea sp.]|uniref:glycosyltransferase family 4 protein n=1 Tax=Zoogloea sp. TaxID=49181 RepID=UPI0014169DB9|nr:MAG: glycosyltransferase family 4 protein [Zoogloea sp.]